MAHTHIHRCLQDRGLKPAQKDLPMHVSVNDRQEVVVSRARPRWGAHTLEWRLFETVAREWKQLFSPSHSFISILLFLIFLTVSYAFSFFLPLLLGFQHVSFSVTTSFSFSQPFPFPLSLSRSLSRSLLVFSLHILMLSQSAVSTAPVGAVLRVIFSGCESVCAWAALIFYLRQVHISPVRCAGLQQDRDCGALTRKQLHRCSFHILYRPTNMQAHFPQGCKSFRRTLEIIQPKQSHFPHTHL